MREIDKNLLLTAITAISSNMINENIVHVLFQRYGHEREIDKIVDEVKEIEEK